jgi:hypothetical protein
VRSCVWMARVQCRNLTPLLSIPLLAACSTACPAPRVDATGRKLRYEVHEKLVSFMAPEPSAFAAPDETRDDLFKALFRTVL